MALSNIARAMSAFNRCEVGHSLGQKLFPCFFFSDPGNPIFSDELNFYDETFFFRRKRPFREKADDTNLELDRVIVKI